MKRQVRQKLEQVLEMPEGIFSGEARLEVYGNRRIFIEGHCHIRAYDEDRIRLETPCGLLCFRGRELRLSEFEKGGAVLTGRLLSIEFD